jgi:hypothetical protein
MIDINKQYTTKNCKKVKLYDILEGWVVGSVAGRLHHWSRESGCNSFSSKYDLVPIQTYYVNLFTYGAVTHESVDEADINMSLNRKGFLGQIKVVHDSNRLISTEFL